MCDDFILLFHIDHFLPLRKLLTKPVYVLKAIKDRFYVLLYVCNKTFKFNYLLIHAFIKLLFLNLTD